MDRDLKGKVALVTGASRGVGRGIAEALGEAKATVFVTGRSVKGGPTTDNLPGTIDMTAGIVTARGGVGVPVRCDHAVDSEVEALFERIRHEEGRLDILVNNVWGGYEALEDWDAPFWEQSLKRWHSMFAMGVRAHYVTSRLAAPVMVAQRQGLIVNISFGDGQKYRGNVVYDVSKTATDRLVVGMARELRKHKVAVLALYPGFVRTERVLSWYEGDLSATQSPQYTGSAVVALAADPDVLRRSGEVVTVSQLAHEYGFTDINGTQPPPFTLRDEG